MLKIHASSILLMAASLLLAAILGRTQIDGVRRDSRGSGTLRVHPQETRPAVPTALAPQPVVAAHEGVASTQHLDLAPAASAGDERVFMACVHTLGSYGLTACKQQRRR
jgi:hypothetical protein